MDKNLQKQKQFLPISAPSITKAEIEAVTDAVRSGWVSSLGEYINRFELEFAAFCQTRFALATSSGTTALHLALVACGIGPGDEVIVPDFTFVATANAVSYAGAKPVLVDINAQTLCIDPAAVRRAITARTRAIIPVHVFGHPAAMRELREIAREHSLLLIEDAAEAHGAGTPDGMTGALGDCAAFSFYGNKILTTGEGGMLATSNEEIYYRALHLRDHAMSKDRRYWHDAIGYNYRMTNLQAALGVAQLGRIDELIARKQEIFLRYKNGLTGLPNAMLNYTEASARNVFWMVYLRIPGQTEESRARVMSRLRERNIDSRPFFYPLSTMPMYLAPTIVAPVCRAIHAEGLCLPSYFDLSNAEVDYVCAVLREILSE